MFTKKIALLMIVFIIAMSFEAAPLAQASRSAQDLTPPGVEYRSSDGQTVRIHYSDQARADAQAKFATRESMMAVSPMPLPAPKGSGGAGLEKPMGKPVHSAPGAPTISAEDKARLVEQFGEPANGPAPENPSRGLTEFAKYYPYVGYSTNEYDEMRDAYPWNTIGKDYFYDAYGDYYCTGTLVDWNVVAIAAHCVYNTDYNYWYSLAHFCPASRLGSSPAGCWDATDAIVLTAWQAQNYYSLKSVKYDLALVYFANPNGYTGTTVSGVFGYLGWWRNLYPKQEVNTIGYPSFYSGDYTYTCQGQTFKKGSGVVGMGCNMENGSSGSSWIVGYAPYDYAWGWSMAVVSGGYPGAGYFYGSQFTDYNLLPLCLSSGWC
jgi:V8-like Glu-specific endopeptidase